MKSIVTILHFLSPVSGYIYMNICPWPQGTPPGLTKTRFPIPLLSATAFPRRSPTTSFSWPLPYLIRNFLLFFFFVFIFPVEQCYSHQHNANNEHNSTCGHRSCDQPNTPWVSCGDDWTEHGEEIRDGLWPSVSTWSRHGLGGEKGNVPIPGHDYLLIERHVVAHSKYGYTPYCHKTEAGGQAFPGEILTCNDLQVQKASAGSNGIWSHTLVKTWGHSADISESDSALDLV